MTDPTLGYATLPIIPSLRGVESMMDRQLSGIMPGVGSRAGSQFGTGFGSAAQKAVDMAADATAASFTAVVATGTAALVKGWSRLTTIQDADAALEISLGSSAEAAALLEDTLDTVRGTPFNLDQFARGAQQLAGMNVEAEKVPHYLEAIGEASATQGARAGEFADRMIDVFGQIQASGQLDLGSVWQISETGVNALAILANAYGVTRDEMKDMISQGAVPAGEALDILSDGILNGSDGAAGATLALAGTMESLRNNMSGAVAGISPALARLGAAVIEPFSPAVVTGANSLVDIIDDLGEEAGDLAQQVAGSAGFEQFMDFLENAPSRAKDLVKELAPAAPVLTGVSAALGAMGSGSLPLIGKYLPMVNPVLAGVVALTLAVPGARAELVDLARDVMPVVEELGDELLPVVEDLSEVAGEVLPPAIGLVGDALVFVLKAGVPVVGMVGDLTGMLADHEGVVTAVAIAYGSWIVLDKASGALDTLNGLVDLSSVSYLRQEVASVAATKGVSNWSAAMEIAKSSLGESEIIGGLTDIVGGVKGMAGEVLKVPDATETMTAAFEASASRTVAGFRAVGSAAMSALPYAAVATVIALGVAWQKAGADSARAIEEMKPPNYDERSISSISDYSATLYSALNKANEARDKLGDGASWHAVRTALKGTAEAVTPMESTVLNTFKSLEDLNDATQEQSDLLSLLQDKYSTVYADITGLDIGDKFLPLDSDALASVERWVTELDLDPAKMKVEDMVAAIEAEVGPSAERIGLTIDEALTIDPEVLKRNTKLVDDAMAATADAFSSFGDILQLTDDPLDPKAAVDARDAVADAEGRLAEARAAAADLESDATSKQRTEAMSRIADAREDLDDAKTALSDLLATDSPLDRAKIADFYEGVIADTETFSTNIQKALEMGYDPAYVGRLLQAGPEQAGPVLEQLVGATTQSFIDMVNNAESELSALSTQATEIARLTQIAVNDSSANGQQMVRDLDEAIAISQIMMASNGTATLDQIATMAGLSSDEVKRVATEYNLALDGIDGRTITIPVVVRSDQLDELVALAGSLGVLDANGNPVKPGAINANNHRLHGGLDHYAAGGLRPSMLGTGSNAIWWDEPATGGEGYFPRLGAGPDAEPNLGVVAGWYGGRYITAKQLAAMQRMPVPSFEDLARSGPAATAAPRRRRRLSRSEPESVTVVAMGASADDVSDAFLFGTRK